VDLRPGPVLILGYHFPVTLDITSLGWLQILGLKDRMNSRTFLRDHSEDILHGSISVSHPSVPRRKDVTRITLRARRPYLFQRTVSIRAQTRHSTIYDDRDLSVHGIFALVTRFRMAV
jgi:hypothetical protein